jgi:uncharacterized protein YdeI (YjbR/CyaY-like superfamily)
MAPMSSPEDIYKAIKAEDLAKKMFEEIKKERKKEG